jgi:hypothetical protein
VSGWRRSYPSEHERTGGQWLADGKICVPGEVSTREREVSDRPPLLPTLRKPATPFNGKLGQTRGLRPVSSPGPSSSSPMAAYRWEHTDVVVHRSDELRSCRRA